MKVAVARWQAPPVTFPDQFTHPPVVIGGCARSGTTLLNSILSCHPAIHAIPEETQMLCPGAFEQMSTCRPPDLERLAALLQQTELPASARRWCEKTPRNARCFATIREALPDAKLISLVRDGRDVCTSLHPGNPSRYWVPPSRWLREINATLEVAGVYTIRYEDIVSDYQLTISKLLGWLGEDWDDALLDYPASARIRTSGAWAHDAIPVHGRSVGRWRQPEHSNRMATFYTEPGTAQMLDRLGYEAA